MMSNDERQGVMPDPNPLIGCDSCGSNHRFEDYWEERYVEPDDVNEYAELWICDECKQIEERRGSNHLIAEYSGQ